jgi:hypothetical protein
MTLQCYIMTLQCYIMTLQCYIVTLQCCIMTLQCYIMTLQCYIMTLQCKRSYNGIMLSLWRRYNVKSYKVKTLHVTTLKDVTTSRRSDVKDGINVIVKKSSKNFSSLIVDTQILIGHQLTFYSRNNLMKISTIVTRNICILVPGKGRIRTLDLRISSRAV